MLAAAGAAVGRFIVSGAAGVRYGGAERAGRHLKEVESSRSKQGSIRACAILIWAHGIWPPGSICVFLGMPLPRHLAM